METRKQKITKGPVGERKVTIRPPLIAILDELAKEWVTDPTELANQAVREWLQKQGLWPPNRGESAA